ncbi:MAG TPA: phosphatidylcholine/phosphatidylserine synthase [Phycisphaerales bacterium]|nr:phosphatidylcholine/phosphatidylserine synthase [Phycisphaerales bacterium]
MFIRYPSKHADVPLRQIVPNVLTAIGLCSGMAALHFATRGDWDRAMYAVLLALVFDGLDGRAARLLRVTSGFGAVLDSLADFLSFGVAPAFILYQWMLKDEDAFGLAAVITYVLCAALRLARFTAAAHAPKPEHARPDKASTKFFTGMPSPAAACAVLLPIMLHESKHVTQWNGGHFVTPALLVTLYTFLVGGLMISRLPMYSFKKLRVPRPLIVPLMALAGILVVFAIKDFWLTIGMLSGVYLLSLPVSIRSNRRLAASGTTGAEHGATLPPRESGAALGHT